MAPNRNLKRLHDAGVSIWLDMLSRQLVDTGEFASLVRECSVTGATSNPTIFARTITGSGARDPQELFFALAIHDVREAAGALRSTYDQSGRRDGLSRSSAPPILPTTPTPRSLKQSICGSASISRT